MSKKSCKFAADLKNPQKEYGIQTVTLTEYRVQTTDLICQI